MASHLIKLGHTRIAYIGDQPFLYGVDAHRLQGHRKALEDHGLTWTEQSFIQISKDFKLRKEDFARILHRVGTVDTAWVFTSDYYATEAVNFLMDNDIRVPQQMTVTGFDDNMLAQMLRPRLTTIHQNVSRKAEKAVRMMLDLLEGNAEQPVSERLPVRLIKGATSCPPAE